jgi:hypothetical protein
MIRIVNQAQQYDSNTGIIPYSTQPHRALYLLARTIAVETTKIAKNTHTTLIVEFF